MGFPAACLIRAWTLLARKSDQDTGKAWRERLHFLSLLLATLSMLLICAFIYSNFNPNGVSFAFPASRAWIISNRAAVIAWVLAGLMLAFGKSKFWLPLLLWTITAPLCAVFIMFMGTLY
jgi:hypothetical protein